MNTSATKNGKSLNPEKGAEWGSSHNWDWNGLRCHWRVLGEKSHPPIVLIHGFGASSSHWRNNAGAFAKKGFCVYGIDLIGFGASEQPSPKVLNSLDNKIWSDQLSAFLEEIVETKKNGKAILIGNSLGSLTALTTLVFQPESIAAAIASPLPDPAFMQPLVLGQRPCWKKTKNFLLKVFYRLFPLEIFVPLISKTPLINIALQAAYHHSIKSDIELKRLISKPAQKATAARALRAMCIGMTTRPLGITAPVLLKVLESRKNICPILLLWGEKDRLVPLSLGQKLVKQHPWLKLSVLKDSGHCPHDESPKEFNNQVLNWLNLNLETTRHLI